MTTTEQMRVSVQVRLQTHPVFVHAEDFVKSLNEHLQKTPWAEPKENSSVDDERRCEFLYLGELSVLNALLGCESCLYLQRDHGSTFEKPLIDQCSE